MIITTITIITIITNMDDIKSAYQLVNIIANRTQSFDDLTDTEKTLILAEYSPMGDRKEWIEWVLRSRKRGVCPYR